MLSSTSLLHGNCIFNRNNTVATQQGMKTYWLCKSYRITMCRARCITHQGRVISATGMHNHQPHMKGSYPNTDFVQSGNGASVSSNGNSISVSMRLPSVIPGSLSAPQIPHGQSPPNSNLISPPQHHLPIESHPHEPSATAVHQSPSTSQHQPHHSEHPSLSVSLASSHPNSNAASLQTMMHNVLSQNNLSHLTNMAPILNPAQTHPHLTHGVPHPNELHASHAVENIHNINSPGSPRNLMHHARPLEAQQHQLHPNAMHSHQQHHPTQPSDNNSPVILSPPVETPPHQTQPTPESDTMSHHSLASEMPAASFKIEQM